MLRTGLGFILLAGLIACGSNSTGDVSSTDATDDTAPPTELTVKTLADGSYVCRPPGAGPFAGVLYSHGGLGDAIGGDLEGTCRALAEAGYLAHSEQRPLGDLPLPDHLQEVLTALDALLAHPDLAPGRVALMGFSRGGLLSLQAAVSRPNDIQALLLFAPAPGKDALAKTTQQVDVITSPVRLYVAENDVYQADHVLLAEQVTDALQAAGKDAKLTIYPPYTDATTRDGHMLFDAVQEPYWSDVIAFLARTL